MSQKERIICEAAEMFLDEGIKSVRMDDIAARLGVSKRTLYEMFSDKNDLLEQSMVYLYDKRRRQMVEGTDAAGNVFEEIFMILGSLKPNERIKTLSVTLKKFHPDIFHRLEEDMHRFSDREFDRLIDRGMEQGLLLPETNKGLARITLTYTMTALFDQKHRFRTHDGLPLEMAFEYVIVNFFRGLSTHKGIEIIDEIVQKYRENKNR